MDQRCWGADLDVVFGVRVDWSDANLMMLRAMRTVHQSHGDHLVYGDWEPLTDLTDQATAAGVHASCWTLDGSSLWTIVNRSAQDYTGPVLLEDMDDITVPAGGIAAVHATTEQAPRLLVTERRWPNPTSLAPPAPRRQMPERVTGEPAANAIRIPADRRTLTYAYRQRETGMYEPFSYVDDWKPLPPRLHRVRSGTRHVELGPVAVDASEVTNAEYAAFLDATGYRPTVRNRFLAHWVDGRPAPGTEQHPVTYVDLDDARAFAAWRGARLPTEDEWLVAAGRPGWRRREPLVWSWTESEHRDGRTRWAVVKGGSWWSAEGSEWYVDGGPRDPEWSVRLLLAGGGLARSECVGFRCAVDFEEDPS